MTKTTTRKRNGSRIYRWHRWVGQAALVFILLVSVTGLLLNRTGGLNLDRIMIRNDLVAALYNQTPDTPPIHFAVAAQWVSWLDGRLYLDERLLEDHSPRPVGAVKTGEMLVIADPDAFRLYAPDGGLIEKMTIPEAPILQLGQTKAGAVVFESGQGKFAVDDDFLNWRPVTDDLVYHPTRARSAPDGLQTALLADYRGQGVSLYRVILDLHSGHILGRFGSYLMDLTALSLIILCITGLMKRKGRKNNR